eukprot:CAMPEP_0118652328 /NCGR_PEP_ID=MMETSP0785-20121206/11259_1 /TAXON_ID=91992 /ORGANISM="Bolidomonas pacifica, Strain CCMP 1866" /LENGTH=178 /DNA_ID=CAMNT_0006544837 /DNA_START=6 /DNA_END=542 /DNA_ORIENTATION=+
MAYNGSVKWFNLKSGFGFITPDDGTDDIFVHRSSIVEEGLKDLRDGEKVAYDVEQDGDKAKAINVVVTSYNEGHVPVKPRKWPVDVAPTPGSQVGTVKWFDTTKGFGFITPLNGGDDVFVHKSSVSGTGKTGRTLMEGEDVEFKIEVDESGKPMCAEVKGPNGEPVQGVVGRRGQRRR